MENNTTTIEFMLGTEQRAFVDFANVLSKAFGQKINFEHNALLFPSSIATGRFELFELEEGLSVAIMDITFSRNVVFVRNAEYSNFLTVHYYLGQEDLLLKNKEGNGIPLRCNWHEVLTVSSALSSVELTIPKGCHYKAINILVNKRWKGFTVGGTDLLEKITEAKGNKNGLLQFREQLSPKMLLELAKMAQPDTCKNAQLISLQGSVRKLLALLYQAVLKAHNADTKNIALKDAIAFVELKSALERLTDFSEVGVDSIIENHALGKSKLYALCKELYGESLGNVILEIRMQTAARLLRTGKSVIEVSGNVGYSNTSHFSMAFHKFYHTSPKQYQSSLSPEKSGLIFYKNQKER